MPKRKILFLFYRSPFNYESSNDRRQMLFYSTLRENFETRILTFGNHSEKSDESIAVELKNSRFDKIFKFITKFQSPRLTHFHSTAFKKLFAENLTSFKPDFIYVEHLLMMQYVIDLKLSAKLIFFNDESNLYLTNKNLRGNLYQRLRSTGLKSLETEACNKSNIILTITNEEETFLYQKGFKNIFTIPFGIDANYFAYKWIKPKENSILFIGDFSHYPNRQAVRFLLKNILPELSDKQVKLKVVGRNTNRIKNLKSKSVEVYDNVKDVRPYYYQSSVFVAPIFTGSGMRTKILEAALCGIPLVISPLANLGIRLTDEQVFICDSKPAFIKMLREYFDRRHQDKIDRMRSSSREKIVNQFNEKIVKEKINSLFNMNNS